MLHKSNYFNSFDINRPHKNMLSSYELDKMKSNERFSIIQNVMQSFLYMPNVPLPLLNDYLQKYIEVCMIRLYINLLTY